MVALNAKLQIAMMVTLNVKLRTDNGSKRQTENSDGAERRNRECGSERQTEEVMMMALNAETKKRWWL